MVEVLKVLDELDDRDELEVELRENERLELVRRDLLVPMTETPFAA